MTEIASKNGIFCYGGPPVWFLSPEWQALIKKMPEAKPGLVTVRVHFRDGKYCDTAVAYDRLIELPDAYNTRDIVKMQRLVSK